MGEQLASAGYWRAARIGQTRPIPKREVRIWYSELACSKDLSIFSGIRKMRYLMCSFRSLVLIIALRYNGRSYSQPSHVVTSSHIFCLSISICRRRRGAAFLQILWLLGGGGLQPIYGGCVQSLLFAS